MINEEILKEYVCGYKNLYSETLCLMCGDEISAYNGISLYF